MDITEIVGFLAGIGTTIAFIPQVIQSLKTKSTKDISLIMYVIFCLGVFLWLIYGFLIGSFPVISANGATLILAIIVLVTKMRYD